MRPARSAWSWMTRRCSRGKSGCGSRSSSSSVRPAIEVSGLLSSCATPETSWPIEAILSFWMSWASRIRCSVTSSTRMTTGRLRARPPRSAKGAAVRRSTRSALLQPRPPAAPVRSPRLGRRDQLVHRLVACPKSVSQKLRPTSSCSVSLGQRRERAVGPEHRAGRAHHGDALGQRVEGGLPFLLAPAHDLVEPAVGQHHRGVGGHGREQPEILGRERAALPVGHGERAHGDALRAERRHRGRAHGHAGRAGSPSASPRPGPPRSAPG